MVRNEIISIKNSDVNQEFFNKCCDNSETDSNGIVNADSMSSISGISPSTQTSTISINTRSTLEITDQSNTVNDDEDDSIQYLRRCTDACIH
mgnify:CR=1 FL=1